MADELPGTTTAPPATTEVATPPSAPASPSPAATPTAPKSVVDETTAVFRAMRDKATPAAPSPAEPDGAAPAQAAIVPAVAGEAPPPVRGPIPVSDHERILANTRRKAREEADREHREKFGWAERLDPKEAEAGANLLRWLNTDPEGAISFLQRQRAQSGQPAAPADPGPPEPDVVLADGSKFYSAEALQKYADHRDQKLMASIDGRYGPMLQDAALSKLRAQATTEATSYRQYYHANFPKFKELEKDIKAMCLQRPDLSIEHAYALVFRDKGLAAEKASWESERAGQLARKAAASSVQPGAAQPGTPRPNSAKSTLEIAQEAWNRKKAAAG